MKMLNRVITGGYWGAYYLVYVLGVAFLVYYFWDELLFLETRHLYVETLFLIGAIYAVSAGTALFVAIIVEVTGRMVLLIPRAWNRAKDEGRAEGLAQGRTEGLTEGLTQGLTQGMTVGQAAERDRVQAILSQYARRDPQTGRLILDQDAEERLLNGKG